jgi:diguanylate cyclase (GGDEF)-like protein
LTKDPHGRFLSRLQQTDIEAIVTLDVQTLLIVTALSSAVSGGVLLVAQDSRTDNESLRTWGLSMLLISMSLVVAVTGRDGRGAYGDLSTILLLLARGMAWSGARRFNGKQPRLVASMMGGAVWGAAIPILPGMAWVAGSSAIAAAYLVLMVVELWPRPGDKLRSRSLLLLLLGVQAAIFLVRTAAALADVAHGPWAETLIRLVLLESNLHMISAAMLMLALVKEQVERKAVMQMRSMAMIDALTGVGNRRHFDEQLDSEMRRARRQGSTVALLLIDVDHFKRFNDAFGHQEGDACLRMIAETVSRFIRRPGDLLARYGGEEFAVLLPDTDLAGASSLAETMRSAVQDAAEAFCPPGHAVTISIGVAAEVPQGEDVPGCSLVSAADRALYRAKAAGRNTVVHGRHESRAEAPLPG